MATIRITKNNLIDVAIQSIKQRNNLSMFWEYVDACRNTGILKMTNDQVKTLIDGHDRLVFGKGMELRNLDKKLPDSTSVYGRDYWRDGKVIDGTPLDGFIKKHIDPTPLRVAIPNYMDVIKPRPLRVYLIDKMTPFWALFKVVVTYRRFVRFGEELGQLYLIGIDRHTKQPFALGIPNGFIDQNFEACLRWTLNAHKGDVAIEV